jgi:HAD superfamily hydrolase (TIGR01509 family)
VLLLKNKETGKSFNDFLAEELDVDIELAKEINKAHYSVMDVKFVPEDMFVADLKKDLDYTAPSNIFSYFARAYEKQVLPNTELQEFLKEMRALGIKTAVLSNTIAIYRGIQQRLGISNLSGFNPILYSWQVEMLKPNKEIYELALRELNVKSEEVIFIDDKIGHLEGARKSGMRTILFNETHEAIEEIRGIIAEHAR